MDLCSIIPASRSTTSNWDDEFMGRLAIAGRSAPVATVDSKSKMNSGTVRSNSPREIESRRVQRTPSRKSRCQSG